MRLPLTSGLAALALSMLACETGASDEGSTTTCGSGCCNPGECTTGESGDGDGDPGDGDGDGDPGDGDGDGDVDVDDCGCTVDEFCMGGGSMIDESCWTECIPRGEACAGVDAPCDDPLCTASLCDGVPFCGGGGCFDVPVFVNWCGDPCDPYAQDCPDGEACNPVRASDTYPWSANCREAGTAAPGEACTLDDLALGNDTCVAGAYCYFTQLVDGVLEGTCVPLCAGSVDDPSCPDGLTCTMEDDLLGVCL